MNNERNKHNDERTNEIHKEITNALTK